MRVDMCEVYGFGWAGRASSPQLDSGRLGSGRHKQQRLARLVRMRIGCELMWCGCSRCSQVLRLALETEWKAAARLQTAVLAVCGVGCGIAAARGCAAAWWLVAPCSMLCQRSGCG